MPHDDSDLPVSLRRKLRRQRRRRRAWRETANAFILLGLCLLAMAFCNFYAGDPHDIGSIWSWAGWLCILLSVPLHIVRACLPTGDPDQVSDDEIVRHEP